MWEIWEMTKSDVVGDFGEIGHKKLKDYRPKAVVGVISGVASTVNVSCLLWAGSGIYGICYLRAFGYFSVSQCATGPARERKVCPGWSRMEGNKTTHLFSDGRKQNNAPKN